MKTPIMEKLNIPLLINAASHLNTKGKLAISNRGLVYLDIDDAYIHELFPFFQNEKIKKPDYFGIGMAGAHITVIYPEENIKINVEELGSSHDFTIKNLVSAVIDLKTYYILLVESSSLLQLRRKYGLLDRLCFKGYLIGFHITIGVKYLQVV